MSLLFYFLLLTEAAQPVVHPCRGDVVLGRPNLFTGLVTCQCCLGLLCRDLPREACR